MKKSKSEYILESIIKAYLHEQNPVGSLTLQESLSVPASTIRVYFQKLGDLGFLNKPHTSGGRVPTYKAMESYWVDFFEQLLRDGFFLFINNEKEIQQICKSFDVFCMIKEDKKLILNKIYNIENKFLVADFSENEFVMRFDENIYALLQSLIGLDISQLQTFLNRIFIKSLDQKIHQMLNSLIVFKTNERSIKANLRIDDIIFSLLNFDKNIDFNTFHKKQITIKIPCFYQGRNTDMIMVGSIFSDYGKIINLLQEAA